MKKDKKKDKPANKTPELSKAKKALDAYFKENNLDPTKDWSKDKKHGKKVTELLNKLNKERDKVAAQYPEKDLKNEAKLVKMKKAKEDEKASKKKEKKEIQYVLVFRKDAAGAAACSHCRGMLVLFWRLRGRSKRLKDAGNRAGAPFQQGNI